MVVPTQLKVVRINQGITIEEVAKQVGISAGTVTRFEQRGWVSPKYILKYAEAINCKVDFLKDLFEKSLECYYSSEKTGGEE